MDEDSILYQAMKNEMSPQVDQAAMKFVQPGSPYQLGLEMRQGGPGGVVTNPTRMARPPSDFAGRPSQMNDNPAYVRQNPTPAHNSENPIRPSGNVINQYQPQMQREKIDNMIRQEMEAMAARRAANPEGMVSRGLKSFRNFIKGMDVE